MPAVSGSGVPPNPRYANQAQAPSAQPLGSVRESAGAGMPLPSRPARALFGFWLSVFIVLGLAGLYVYSVSPKTSLFSEFPGLKVKGLRFFESGYEALPIKQRHYQTNFSRTTARYINWEIEFAYSPRRYPVKFPLTAVYWRNGQVFTRFTANFQTDRNWSGSFHAQGWGFKENGHWPVGNYLVEISSEGKFLARNWFKVE